MPVLPDVPNALRVRVQFSIGADLAAGCRFYFSYTGSAPSSATCATFASDIGGYCSTDWVPMMNSGVTLNEIEVTDLSTTSGGSATHPVSESGTRGGNQLPDDVCLLMNHFIGRRYRGGKPRHYLPWGDDNDISTGRQWQGSFVSASLASFQSWIASILGESVGGTAISNHVNISYYQGFTPFREPSGRYRNIPNLRAAPQVDIITGSSANPVYGSQRRRLRTT